MRIDHADTFVFRRESTPVRLTNGTSIVFIFIHTTSPLGVRLVLNHELRCECFELVGLDDSVKPPIRER